MTGPAVHACPAWHLDYERGFAYVRFPLRSWLAGMRLSNEPISNETLLLRVASGDRAAFRDLYAVTAPRLLTRGGDVTGGRAQR
jgi:hypothetical protein